LAFIDKLLISGLLVIKLLVDNKLAPLTINKRNKAA